MACKFTSRLEKLEAQIPESSPFDELSDDQLTALSLCLKKIEGQEITDEQLRKHAISRRSFEAAVAGLTEEQMSRLRDWVERRYQE
jgi:hypothetical protein